MTVIDRVPEVTFKTRVRAWQEENFLVADEMKVAAAARTIGKVATRLNYDLPGSRSVSSISRLVSAGRYQ